MRTISIATTDEQILRCFPVMVQLRPRLTEPEFLERVKRQKQTANYTLACLIEDGTVLSVAGFRISECLFYGPFLYVDDLVTDESARSRGFGGLLLDWLVDHARCNGCEALTLDSGVQRADAHRFYVSHDMQMDCYHFALRFK